MTSLPLIAVDIGNSSTKLGWAFAFDEVLKLPAPTRSVSFVTGRLPTNEMLTTLPASPVHWAIASVHREGSRLLSEWIATHRPADFVQHLAPRDLPINARVVAPDKVGLDRLAAAVAANKLRGRNSPAIIIDAGSAITVDLVAADGAFEGGAILPGFSMSARALDSADLLPLATLEPNDEPPAALGKDTNSAIRSGLFWGAVGAVRELVQRLSAAVEPSPEVIVTGGDLRQLANQLPGSRFVPNLVLAGIALAVLDTAQDGTCAVKPLKQ